MNQIETQKKVAEVEYKWAKAVVDEALTYQSFLRVTSPVLMPAVWPIRACHCIYDSPQSNSSKGTIDRC
jgi:hypothetical protein